MLAKSGSAHLARTGTKKFLILLEPHQRRQTILLLAGMLAAAMLEVIGIGAIPAFVALLIEPDRIIASLPAALTDPFRSAGVTVLPLVGAFALAGLFLFKNLYLAGLNYAEGLVLRGIVTGISIRLFRLYLLSPYSFHLQRNPAHLMRNVTSETVGAVEVFHNSVMVLRESLVLGVVFLLLMIVDPLVSLSVFVLLGTAAGAFYVGVRRASSKRGALAQGHRGRQILTISQGLGAIKDAKILGLEPYLVDLFSVETISIERHEWIQRTLARMPRLFLEVVAIAAILLVVVVFVLLDRPIQTMVPVLTLLSVAVVRLVPAFNMITSSLTLIRYSRPSLDLVCEELEALESIEVSSTPRSTAAGTQSDRGKIRSTIQVRNLHYRYPDASTEALRGISLTIHAREAVAFVGPSGAGKSTLVDVILGLLMPNSGQVCVDGQDIQQDLCAWQRQIGYVPQDIYLIDDSIRRNIAFGLADKDIDEAAIDRAVKAAHLGAFVADLPDRLDTEVGNRGIRLSGGQRQRIGIARALYHDPAVLVLDEATSALDNETERQIIETIGLLRGDRTVIMVAHRLTTVIGCERIFLLNTGQLKDSGSYKELSMRHPELQLRTSVPRHAG